MVSLNQCMKCTLISAIVFSTINAIAYIIAWNETDNAVENYGDYSMDMIDSALNVTTSNFNETSEWFIAIAVEYEALSDFDKENVYCDVVSIQASPDASYQDAYFESGAARSLMVLACVGAAFVTGNFFCKRYNKFYGIDVNDIGPSDPNAKIPAFSTAVIIKRPDAEKKSAQEQKFEKESEMLSDYRYDMMIQFITAGPFIGLTWLLVTRRSSVDGLDCQEMFYECGLSGDCNMDDMMTTVALNSSLISMLASYPMLICAFFAPILSLCFVLGSGIFLSIGTNDWRYATLPAIMFVYGGVPFVWVYFVDPFMPFEPVLAILTFAALPMVFQCFYVCYDCHRSCKGTHF